MRRWFVVSRDIVSFNALSRACSIPQSHSSPNMTTNKMKIIDKVRKSEMKNTRRNSHRIHWIVHHTGMNGAGMRKMVKPQGEEIMNLCGIATFQLANENTQLVDEFLLDRCWCWPLFFYRAFRQFYFSTVTSVSGVSAIFRFAFQIWKWNKTKCDAANRRGKKIRRHNLSFVWLVHMDEFSVCSSRISCCCALDLLHRTTQSHVEIRKCLIIGRSVHCAWHSGTQTPKPANAGPVKIDPKPKCKFGRSRWNEKWERDTTHK